MTEIEELLRNVLERLGPPEEIAAEAGAGTTGPERGRLETAAMVVLAVSFVLPFVGYLIGAGQHVSRPSGPSPSATGSRPPWTPRLCKTS